MRFATHLALMASLCLLLVSSAHGAETGSNASGPYVRGAVAFGFLNLTQGGSTKTQFGSGGAFVTNLGLGADVMLGEGLGLYAEAAYKLFVSGQIDGISNVNAGVILRF